MQNQPIKLDPFIKGSGEAIKLAAAKLKRMGYIQLKILSDQKGAFCIEYPKFFLTFNRYLYHKKIVSNQKEIIYRAKILNKDLVVYVLENDTFYIFDPSIIIADHWENIRGYMLMYNWSIDIGRIMHT